VANAPSAHPGSVSSPTFDALSDFVADVRAEEQSQQKDDEQRDTDVVADFLEYIVGVQGADVLTGVDGLGHQGVRNRHVLGSCHTENMRGNDLHQRRLQAKLRQSGHLINIRSLEFTEKTLDNP